jgi:serine/threonine-protein kinase SRPK3
MPRNSNTSVSDDSASYSDDDEFSDIEDDFCGCVLNDRYILLTDIGAGAYATIYLSYDYKDKKYYAIKVQNADEYDSGKEEVDIFKTFQSTKCKYLNKMNSHFVWESEVGEHVCMVFDLLAGSLYDLLNKGKKGIHVRSVKKMIYQLLLAMDELNSKYKLLHTDVKPENVLLVGVSNKVQSIITEFEKFDFHKIYNKKRKRNKDVKVEDITIDLVSKLSCNLDKDNDSQSSEYSSDNNMSDKQDEVVVIDDKYTCYDNLQIKLSDFGSSYKITDNMDFNIQTRYYRSPDVILEYPFNETCDVWSVGCMIYEMITGEILFDPIKKKRFNRDRYHIYDMQTKLGLIPEELLKNSNKRSLFFRNNGLIKGRDNICYNPLSTLFIDKLKDRLGEFKVNNILQENQEDGDEGELDTVIDLMLQTLDYHPTKRLTVKQCLKHKWFDEYRKSSNST